MKDAAQVVLDVVEGNTAELAALADSLDDQDDEEYLGAPERRYFY